MFHQACMYDCSLKIFSVLLNSFINAIGIFTYIFYNPDMEFDVLDSILILLFLLLIKFIIVFQELITVLIPRWFRIFSLISVVELLSKIRNLCNVLLFEKLLLWISREHLCLGILRAFI